MMPSRKKDNEAAWHPDFRNIDRLPDIKPVRTGFLINAVAVLLPLLLAVYYGNAELERMQLNDQITDVQQQVAQKEPLNKKIIAESKEFADAAKSLRELNAFYGQWMNPMDLFLALTESRPEPIVLGEITIGRAEATTGQGKNKKTVTLQEIRFSGTVDGLSEDPLGTLREYENTLRELPAYAGKVHSFDFSGSRIAASNSYSFSVNIKINPAL